MANVVTDLEGEATARGVITDITNSYHAEGNLNLVWTPFMSVVVDVVASSCHIDRFTVD